MASKSKSATLPFLGVSEGLDLVKKVWGVTGLPMLPTPSSMAQFATRLPQTLPSMIAPTLDVDELDKRIADLRAVEQWLNLNLSMLRTTVQSLEVQRNTIATLKSFGGAMLSAGPHAPAAPPLATGNWPYPAGYPEAASPPARAPAPAAHAPEARPARKRRSPREAAAAAAAALPLNPTAWWNTLQDQFTKIAATAAAEAQAAARASAKEDAAKARAAAAKAAQKKAPATEGNAVTKPPARKAAARRRKRQPPRG
jgi:hypothetical protein